MDSNIRTHIQVVGWLNILTNIGIVFFGALFMFVPAFLSVLSAVPFMGVIGLFALPIMLYGLLGIVAGFGMIQFAPWSRVLGIIVAILHLANVTSFGLTLIVGVYTLIVLLSPAAARELR